MSTCQTGNSDRQSAQRRRAELGFDEAQTSAWLNFESAAIQLHDAVNRGLVQAHHLTLADVQMLGFLKNNGPSPMGAVAEALMVTPGALSQQVQRLERRQLVHRRASRDDGRRVMAMLTLDGARCLHAAMQTYGRLVRVHFLDELSRSQMIALGDACRRVSDRLKGGADLPPDRTPS